MSDIDKSTFIWNIPASYGGDVKRIARALADGGFQSAMLHHQNLSQWRSASRIALISELRAVGVEPIGSAAVYYGSATEGQQAAAICNDYGLSAFVLDAEATYDGNDPDGKKTPVMLNAFRAATDARIGWCSWARHLNPLTGAEWHPIAVLKAAMPLCDFGVPMMYWGGETPSAATTLAQQSFTQWREVTDKPLVPAGRAYTGDGGTATAEAIRAFEAAVHGLSDGVTWWSMEHAVALGLWETLEALPAFGEQPLPPEIGGNMKGILVTSASGIVDAEAVASSGYDFGYVRMREVFGSGTRDDQKLSANRDALSAAGFKLGAFADLDWRVALEAVDSQANELKARSAGGAFTLPPGIRLEDISGETITDWPTFSRELARLCFKIFSGMGRWPVIFANRYQIERITGAMNNLGSQDYVDYLNASWWGLIAVDNAPLPAPWTRYPFFVDFPAVSVPGASGVFEMQWPGTLAQLLAWRDNPTLDNIPAWGEIVEPPPEDDDTIPPPPPPPAEETQLDRIESALAALTEQLDRIEAAQAAQAARWQSHYKEV